MSERAVLLIDGPNPATATLADWEAYLLELESLAAENDVDEEIDAVRATIAKLKETAKAA